MALVIANESSMPWDEKWEDALTAVAREALAGEDFSLDDVEIGLTLTDDAAIAQLNEQFRATAGPTDVLSFPIWSAEQLADVLSSPEKYPERPLLLGDVVISTETAQRQAAEYGHGFGRELAFLFVHGVLHLLGYEHDDESSRRAMRAKEEAVLAATGWTR